MGTAQNFTRKHRYVGISVVLLLCRRFKAFVADEIKQSCKTPVSKLSVNRVVLGDALCRCVNSWALFCCKCLGAGNTSFFATAFASRMCRAAGVQVYVWQAIFGLLKGGTEARGCSYTPILPVTLRKPRNPKYLKFQNGGYDGNKMRVGSAMRLDFPVPHRPACRFAEV